jgi:DNA-binding transcriptional LysR family regulator
MEGLSEIVYICDMPVQKRSDPDWEDLRYFLALARHGSLSAAARALKVSHATVARRVASLEAALQAPLFDRRADGYAPTARGRRVEVLARTMEEAAQASADMAVVDAGLSGLVRLTMAGSMAERFVTDRLGDFHKQHPRIDLEIVVESRVISLSRREADIAVRFGRPKDSELLARRLSSVAFSFYASRSYAKTLDKSPSPAMIGFDDESNFIADAAWLNREFPQARFIVRTNSQATQAAAARAGLGVAQLPLHVGGDDPRLVPVKLAKNPPDREIWMLLRKDVARLPRVRAVADYLAAMFRRDRRVLTG